jgi:hypothetical protein
MTTSSLYSTHTIISKVPQSSSEFQTQIQPQRRTPIGRWVKNKKDDIEYPFEHGEVITYTLDGVSIHPVKTNIQTSFLTQLLERMETAQGFYHEANGCSKTVFWF